MIALQPCPFCGQHHGHEDDASVALFPGIGQAEPVPQAPPEPEVVIAPWSPANGDTEAVGVYSALSNDSAEWQIWDTVIKRIDPLIDKDFSYSAFNQASITLSHQFLGGDGVLGIADFYDLNPFDQIFDIAVDVIELDQYAQGLQDSYFDLYEFIATHELGHALGLKHPFDDFDGTLPADNTLQVSDTVMSYSGPLSGFSNLDIAALIQQNGIEDDSVSGETPVYRFFNDASGGHFFTSSADEATYVATELYDNFSFEGTAFYANGSNPENNEAIYRFFNDVAGGHFFTASEGERDFVISELGETFTYEGIGFYASAEEGSLSEPVYRFFNNVAGGHFFTGSAGERDFVAAQLSDQFTYEGIAFYA